MGTVGGLLYDIGDLGILEDISPVTASVFSCRGDLVYHR